MLDILEAVLQALFWIVCGFAFGQAVWRAWRRSRKPKPVGKRFQKHLTAPREARRKARNAQGRTLGFGGCKCCGDTWDWKISHDTPLENSSTMSACFPLCEECWQRLGTPENRWPYYEAMVNEWEYHSHADPGFARGEMYREALGLEPFYPEVRELVLAAVRAGR